MVNFEIVNRQRRHPVDLALLEARARAALPLCLGAPGSHGIVLPGLRHLEVSLLSDRAIAPINWKFLGHRGPTDVITFQHGEIVMSVEIAFANAAAHGKTPAGEIALYLIHGLLHLNGWSDREPVEARRMHALQEKILARTLKSSP